MAKRIGELLVEGGILSQAQLEQALFTQRKDGRKLGQVLVDLGLVSEMQVTQTLSRQLSVPWVSLYHVDFSRALLNLVPREVAERYSLVPIFVRRVRKHGETLYVAMDDPTNEAAIEAVRHAAGLPVKPMIASPSDVRAAIRVYYLGESPGTPSAPQLAVVPSAPAEGTEPAGAKPQKTVKVVASPVPAEPPPSSSEDSPESVPDIEAEEREVVTRRRPPRPMISLTLLDGTTISLPTPRKRQPSRTDEEEGAGSQGDRESSPADLTARDLVSALRALAHGADASEILGDAPRWEALFAAVLSIMLRKGLIADWEFVEEYRKV